MVCELLIITIVDVDVVTETHIGVMLPLGGVEETYELAYTPQKKSTNITIMAA